MTTAAIVIPIYKDDLTPDEMVSLQQCFSILGKHKIFFLSPNEMQSGKIHKEYTGKAAFIFLDDKYFKSIASYNYLMLSIWFYKLFQEYEYMLIYHLDAFVFRDDLDLWMEKGYSYIGAPWFMGNSNEAEVDDYFGVGNGGFSLRNIKDTLKVLKSTKKIWSLKQFLQHRKSNNRLHHLKGLMAHSFSTSFKNVRQNRWLNEDKVFCQAGKRFDFFKVPPPEEALSFAFEKQSEKLFRLNQNRLPFGCHAWWKFNLEFYIPHIESFGYNLNRGSIENTNSTKNNHG